MKKFLKVFLLVVTLLFLSTFTYNVVTADSGFDSSFDSGGSSIWDSGSSFSSSSDFGSSGGEEISGGEFLIFIMPFIILEIVSIIVIISVISSKKNYNIETKVSGDVDYINNNKEQLEKEVFRIYKEVQEAWMNFDYDALRGLVTDEMYNMYSNQLKTLKLKSQKNIMNDIQMTGINVYYYKTENNITTMKAKLSISMYDYLVDGNNSLIRGSNTNKINITYDLTFIKHEDVSDYCPNCGAKLENNNSNCEYCNTIIVKGNSNFVLSKKQNINQW